MNWNAGVAACLKRPKVNFLEEVDAQRSASQGTPLPLEKKANGICKFKPIRFSAFISVLLCKAVLYSWACGKRDI